ncbi:MAG: 16S rRNA (guanine(966)-N(2))-methyltransferase RsmD [Gammaproteobacteria bacterium]|nr:16S rRNA (guanine(966)-N(2))-methyltransferase RsmD [Gammaproteobacteria bacterium]
MKRGKPPGRFRVIAGRWRGRRFPIPRLDGLRPTPDRVRETAFNWLQPVIDGACCLDLYAGSGALGVEALSRGARRVVFVERDAQAVASLRNLLSTLDSADAEVVRADALAFLDGRPQAFDVVLLDPPFADGFPQRLCTLLETRGWLAAHARIFLEHARRSAVPPLPANWTLHRSRHAGQVAFHLALRSAPA